MKLKSIKDYIYQIIKNELSNQITTSQWTNFPWTYLKIVQLNEIQINN